jgi:hypothetical protein
MSELREESQSGTLILQIDNETVGYSSTWDTNRLDPHG